MTKSACRCEQICVRDRPKLHCLDAHRSTNTGTPHAVRQIPSKQKAHHPQRLTILLLRREWTTLLARKFCQSALSEKDLKISPSFVFRCRTNVATLSCSGVHILRAQQEISKSWKLAEVGASWFPAGCQIGQPSFEQS